MLLAGCSRSVDSRLVLADKLIDECADSAFIVLKGIDPHELTRSSDKAYYALLYTQAQYKNFDSIPNDSLINIALHHYSDNHNRELNTRTLIYKGAVMQELGKEQEAMEWYKRAEDNASEDDYMNLGQANLRMAVLYSLNYTDNRVIIEKYKQALYNFQKAGSKQYQVMCLSSIGGELRNINIDSAIIYLEKSIQLSKELDNSFLLYRSSAMLTRAYFSKNHGKPETRSGFLRLSAPGTGLSLLIQLPFRHSPPIRRCLTEPPAQYTHTIFPQWPAPTRSDAVRSHFG